MKLMFRNKSFLLLMIIMPIIVIALLSSAFKDMMAAARDIDPFTVGYRITANSPYQTYLPEWNCQ
jgi:ABC-2 type transport system permease protein